MSLVAAAVVGGAVIGGVASNRAAKKGANAQSQAAQMASDTELQMYNQSREDQMPWLNQGKTSLNQLAGLMAPGKQLTRNFSMADFRADPGYRFRLREGMRGVENSAAARGGLLSGNTLKALANYNQQAASNEYMNSYNRFNNDNSTLFNRLAALANTGQTTANSLGALGSNTAQSIGSNAMAAGNARASGYAGQANALNGLVNNGIGLYAGYKNGMFGKK